MGLDRINLGRLGETITADFLVSKNYTILQRNYRAKQYGEVDIICIHPNKRLLVFVEVKTRMTDEFGRPEEAVTKGKLHELKKMVDYYFNQNPQTMLSPQIDAVAVLLNPDKSVKTLEHFENITL